MRISTGREGQDILRRQKGGSSDNRHVQMDSREASPKPVGWVKPWTSNLAVHAYASLCCHERVAKPVRTLFQVGSDDETPISTVKWGCLYFSS